MLKIVTDDADRDDLVATLDELVAEGAQRMLMAGLTTEVADYVARHEGLVDEAGHRLVVRNGRAAERTLVTGAGALKIRAPLVNDRREGRRFLSYILPRYARRSPKVADVLPVLYLRGLSTGDFVPALSEFFGSDAGLSASSITGPPRDVGRRVHGVRIPRPGRVGLRVCVGRRRPFSNQVGRGPVVLSRCDRRESRWHQGVAGVFGRV